MPALRLLRLLRVLRLLAGPASLLTSPYPELPGLTLQPTLQLVWWTPLQLALQLISQSQPPAPPAFVPLARCLGSGVEEDSRASLRCRGYCTNTSTITATSTSTIIMIRS